MNNEETNKCSHPDCNEQPLSYPDHLHVKLPSGAIANVSPDCSQETLNTINEMAKLAIKAAEEGTLKGEDHEK